MGLRLGDGISSLKGVGEKRALLYHKLGVKTIGDLLEFYPRKYIDYSTVSSLVEAAKAEEPAAVLTTVTEIERPLRVAGGRTLYRALTFDEAGIRLRIVFFNNPYPLRYVKLGEQYRFYGKVTGGMKTLEMLSPHMVLASSPVLLESVYAMTAGLTSYAIRRDVKQAYQAVENDIVETMPEKLRREHGLCHRAYAIRTIHFPPSFKECEVAKRRLSFEELLTLQLALGRLKKRGKESTGICLKSDNLTPFLAQLPFSLTGAQKRVILESVVDLRSGFSMNRLVQGDVGSGKTMVAAALAYLMIGQGYQCALMVPTEILAQQHYETFRRILEPLGISCLLVTGGLSSVKKREAATRMENGSAQMVIGTHALLTKERHFHRLGLVITDEQHRFGVEQRMVLGQKGERVHTLVMSATPIPRTLALILYGDLDLSVLDEMPPGRQPVETYLIGSSKRARALRFLSKFLEQGRQIYIVCPLVEENEGTLRDVKSVEQYGEELSKGAFAGYSVGFLHGKMKAKEKEKVMQDFKEGKIAVLVATTVIEVGVDVQNATGMLIENAERFGLSQLHQLRGRIGRGSGASTCILLSDKKGETTRQRLEILTKTSDGFRLAEEDLKLRGPGDFFGSRQHGLPSLKMAELFGDSLLFEESRKEAQSILSSEKWKSEEYRVLAQVVERIYQKMGETGLN